MKLRPYERVFMNVVNGTETMELLNELLEKLKEANELISALADKKVKIQIDGVIFDGQQPEDAK